MKFNDWIGKRSQFGHQCREERIQALTDQYWQAKVNREDELAAKFKHKLNVEYDTVVMESTGREADILLKAWREARSHGYNELANEIYKILNHKYDIAIFT